MTRRTCSALLCGLLGPALAAAQGIIDPIFFAAPRNVNATDGNQSLELSAIAAGDLDGDDDVDLVVGSTNFDLDTGPVILLENNGAGRFQIADQIEVRIRPGAIAVADFDGDGALDLAAALIGSDEVAVLLGVGDGRFLNAVRFDTGNAPVHLAVGDVNGDDLPDLVTSNEEDDTLTVLINDGAGGFEVARDVNVRILDGGPARSEPNAAVVGDFNGDGLGDLAATLGARDQVAIVLNEGSSDFTTISLLVDVGDVPSGLAAGDVNDDGAVDLVVCNSIDDSVQLLKGDGAGGFEAGEPIQVGNRPEDVLLVDLDRDGALDIVTANFEGDDVSVLAGNGDATFAAAEAFDAGAGPLRVLAADLNGDGRFDLATANREASASADADVSVLLASTPGAGNGDGSGGLPDCGMNCGPLGLAPAAFTLLGIAGLKTGWRRTTGRRSGQRLDQRP